MYSVLLLVIPKVRMARTTQKDMEKHPRQDVDVNKHTQKKKKIRTRTVLDMGKVLRCNAQAPPYRAQEERETKSQQPASQQKKKKKGFDQDQALYNPRQTRQHTTHTPSKGVHLAKAEAVRTHVPKPCPQPLTDPLPKVGARCRGRA